MIFGNPKLSKMHWMLYVSTYSQVTNIKLISLARQHPETRSIGKHMSIPMWPANEGYVKHYSDVIMGAIASQPASLTLVYSTVYSGADQRKYHSSVTPAFVPGIHRWPVNSPYKWPVTRKMFPFDDVIMNMTTKIGTIGNPPGDIIFNSFDVFIRPILVNGYDVWELE